MTTALEKLLAAMEGEKNGQEILSFVFRFNGFEFDYMGRYYAYVYEGSSRNRSSEDEYGWRSYNDMLDGTIRETGRTVRHMLSEIPAHDLEIEYDVLTPPHSELKEP